MTERWAGKAAMLAAMLVTALPAVASAQAGRYGAVPNVPLASGQGWTGRNWTGPEDGPDMRRLPVDAGRDTPPLLAERPVPPMRAERPVDAARMTRAARSMPPLRTDGPATMQYTGRYVRPYRGWTMPTYFETPAFQVRDFPTWGLAPPGPGRHWVRYYDDAVLVGPGGRVDDVRYDIDWNRRGLPRREMADRGPGRMPDRLPDRLAVDGGIYDSGYEDGYADGRSDGADRGYPVDERGYVTRHAGYAPGTTVVTTTPGTITTTTTTEEIVYSTPRRARTAARKTWVARSPRWSK